MQVIKPIPLVPGSGTPSIITTSGFLADSTPSWNPGTTYAIGDVVKEIGSNGKKYKAIQSSTGVALTNTSYWTQIGYINEFAYLDTQSSTTAVGNSISSVPYISFTLQSPFDVISLINVIAESVHVTISSPYVSYDRVIQAETTSIYSWYDYFFAEKTFKKDFVFDEIPISFSGNPIPVLITFEPRAINPLAVEVGSLIVGQLRDIGGTQYGAKLGIVDYSKKTTDDFGTTTFVKRAFSKRMSANTFLLNTQLASVFNTLSEIRATPTVWIASQDSSLEEPTTVYGYYKDFSIDIQYPAHSLCSLEIEGLT